MAVAASGFLCCYAKHYTALCNPPMNHPDTFVCRLLRLQRELRTQSRFHLSGVLQTLSWYHSRRCAHHAGPGYWDDNRPAPVVYEQRWGRPARGRGSRHATGTNTIRENNRHGVADLDPGTGRTRTKRVSWVRARLVCFCTMNGFSHRLEDTRSRRRSGLTDIYFFLQQECFHTFRTDKEKNGNQPLIVHRGRD